MALPTIHDYSEAIQNPNLCFRDPELARAKPSLNKLGLPAVSSGNFATVYPLSVNGKKYAVRCFYRELKNQEKRYSELHQSLKHGRPPYFIQFEFIKEGIKVKGAWHPIIKMEWVEGLNLDKYLEQHLNNPQQILKTAETWRDTVKDLQSRDIAHNDLQQGNVMINKQGAIRLVDYDGIFLPQYQGQSSPEEGHPNFKHPGKTTKNYNLQSDNFPAIVIYLSILALADNKELWKFNGQENLILQKDDYSDPRKSPCFRMLRESGNQKVRDLTEYLEQCLKYDVDQVPYLENVPCLRDPSRPLPKEPASRPPEPKHPEPPRISGAPPLSYKQMLLDRQQEAAKSAAQPTPQQSPTTVRCPRCGKENMANLVYCIAEECLVQLHQGRAQCRKCGVIRPMKAAYCPWCGASQLA